MKTLFSLILFVAAGNAFAQPFTIKSYTIGAPGGTSSGKAHALKGTVGQYDAIDFSNRLSPFSISGGFWQIAGQPRGPILRIAAGGRSVIVAWPNPSTDFQLQQTSSLNPVSWSDVRATPSVVGNEKQVSMPLQGGPLFFRLRKEKLD